MNIGQWGMDDEEIIPLLHGLNSATFFTRDRDFFKRRLCHANYCLVHMVVDKNEVAHFVRRLLRHPALKTRVTRMGKVVPVMPERIYVWQLHSTGRQILEWPAP